MPNADKKTVTKHIPVIISKMPVPLGKFPKFDFNFKIPNPKKIIIIPKVIALEIKMNMVKLSLNLIDAISEISKIILVIIINKAISSTK